MAEDFIEEDHMAAERRMRALSVADQRLALMDPRLEKVLLSSDVSGSGPRPTSRAPKASSLLNPQASLDLDAAQLQLSQQRRRTAAQSSASSSNQGSNKRNTKWKPRLEPLKATKSEMERLLGAVTPTAPELPSAEVTGQRQTNVWLRALASGCPDPVRVGRECIECCGVELDECLQSLAQELRFLHSLCGGQSGMPRQAAESCLQRGEQVAAIWRNEHLVVWQLMGSFERERERFLRDSSPEVANGIQMDLNKATKALRQSEARVEEAEVLLEEYQGVIDDMARFHEGSDMTALREHVAMLKSSRAPEILEQLYQQMLLAASKRAKGGRALAARPAPAKPLIADMSRFDAEDDDSSGRPQAAKGNQEEEEEEEEQGSIEGEGDEDGLEPLPATGAKSRNIKVVSGGDKRRTGVRLQDNIEASVRKLDEVQQSQMMARMLANARKPTLTNLFSDMDEGGQRCVVASLMEGVADGKVRSFVTDLLVQCESDRDRVDLVLEFMRQLDEPERQILIPALLDDMGQAKFLSHMSIVGEGGNGGGSGGGGGGVGGANCTSTASLTKNNKGKSSSGDLTMLNTVEARSKQTQTQVSISVLEEPCETSGGSGPASAASAKHAIYSQMQKQLTALTMAAAAGSTKAKKKGGGEGEAGAAGNSDGEAGNSDSEDEDEDEDAFEEDDKEHGAEDELTFSTMDIKNKALLEEGGNFEVTVTLKRVRAKNLSTVSLPWEKYLGKPPKSRRAHKMDAAHFEKENIGEVYQKKIMADQSVRGSSRRVHSLAKTILHYFTQKYGLKKLAEEYLYGVVKTIRSSHAHSSRIRLFGILVGVLEQESYSPALCDVAMEHLSIVLPKHDHISKYFEQGAPRTTYVHAHVAVKAVRAILRLTDGDTSGAADTALHFQLGEDDGHGHGTLAGVRTWTVPGPFRQKLLKWIEQSAVPEVEVNKATTSEVKVVNCDDFLNQVVAVFMDKVRLDRYMITQLFNKFDVDCSGSLDIHELTELLQACQPTPPLDESQIMDLWHEVNDLEEDDDDDTITPEGFATVCINKNLQLPYWRHDTENLISALASSGPPPVL